MENNMSKVFTDVSVFLSAVGQETPATPQKTVSDQAQLYKQLIEDGSNNHCSGVNSRIGDCFYPQWSDSPPQSFPQSNAYPCRIFVRYRYYAASFILFPAPPM
jgi:hypothetical protein